MHIYSKFSQFSADIYTPIELYLSLRHHYRKTCLLESNDYHSRKDSKSFIGCDPIVELTLTNLILTITTTHKVVEKKLVSTESFAEQIQKILDTFSFSETKFNGFFGRIGFEFTLKDETHIEKTSTDSDIPDLHLFVYKYIIVIDHFTSDGFLIENSLSFVKEATNIEDLFRKNTSIQLPFETLGEEESDFSEKEFLNLIEKGINHCKRGDVFQLVLSNEFRQHFFGDDFLVYRELRRLNPSPYLFYFDFENYRLFGSSPEAQILINGGKAEIHPIAGTVPLTGVEQEDQQNVDFLTKDEKENSEHTMLVDLARNDLSRDCSHIKLEKYKEVQYFSHVIHLVSKVTGVLKFTKPFVTLTHSFPAGTLSGTPKPRALELIQKYERGNRNFYGGSIGYLGANGDVNMAIVIRSIMSQNNILHLRAGAGIVLESIPKKELREVHLKLQALRSAIKKTESSFKPSNVKIL